MATAMKVRNSERQSFLTCRQQWYWAWVDSLKPIEERPALEFGDYVHQALALYYKKGKKRGPHPAKTFEKMVTARMNEKGPMNFWNEEDWVEGLDLGVRMLEGYIEKGIHHQKWPDDELEVISSEQTFQLPMGRISGQKIIIVGTFDGIVRHLPSGRLRFLEHKTTKSISKDALPMDEQAGTYSTFGPRWLMLQKWFKADVDKFDGILYNYLRKAVPNMEVTRNADGLKLNKPTKKVMLAHYKENKRPLPKGKPATKVTFDDLFYDLGEDVALQLGEISKVQDSPFFDRQLMHRGETEAERVKARLRMEIRDMIQARENPDEHVYKNPGPQFMPNCRMCQYRDMCEVHETGNDYEAMIPGLYTVWDGYADHELAERS